MKARQFSELSQKSRIVRPRWRFGVDSDPHPQKHEPNAIFQTKRMQTKSKKKKAEQRQDKNPYCVDVYTYTFTHDSATLASEPDEKQHNLILASSPSRICSS